MPSQRATHSKSRYGCAQCKSRRLKCDETRPVCQRCQRSNLACSFSHQQTRTPLATNDEILNTEDMYLLYHFTTASKDFSVDDSPRETSSDDPIALAFSHHYLLHSILALSALHLFSAEHERTYYDPAISHHDAAIRQARPHLLKVEKHHAEALFWFTVFTSLFAFAEPLLRPESEKGGTDYIEEILNAFRLGRGMKLVMAQLDGNSVLGRTPSSGYYDDNREELQNDLHQKYPELGQLKLCISQTEADSLDPDQMSDCIQAAEKVFLYTAILEHDPNNKKSTNLIMVWAIEVSDQFLELCHAKHPAAIATLAVYSRALNSRQWFWSFRGWSTVLLKHCEDALSGSNAAYQNIIEFAKRKFSPAG